MPARTTPGPDALVPGFHLRFTAARLAGALLLAVLLDVPPADAAVTMQDLVEAARPSAVTISRNGKQIAWVVTKGDVEGNEVRSRVWVWREKGFETLKALKRYMIGGEPEKKYRVFTHAEDDADSPAFSVDGRWLAFLAARGEDAKTQVWVLPLDGGEAQPRTSSPTGVDQYYWTPDGEIVYLASAQKPTGVKEWRETRKKSGFDAESIGKDRPRRGFWRVSADGSRTDEIWIGGPGIEDFALSPDGKRIAYRDNGTGDPADWNDIDLWRLDVDAPEPSQLTDRLGDEWDPQWSFDGETVFFLATVDSSKSFSQAQIFSVSAEGGPMKQPWAEFDRYIDSFRAATDIDRLFGVVVDGTNRILGKFFPASGTLHRIAEVPGRVRSIAVSDNGERVAFVHAGPEQAREICIWKFDNKVFDRLTDLNEDLTARADASHEIVSWTAGDGLEIEGVLIRPAEGEAPYPTIVYPHGGPSSAAVNSLMWYEADAMAGRGYAIFAPNVRGSTGYGRPFNVANYRDLGGADYDDMMSGVDYLIEQGIADPERLGITGTSYGGFLTNVAITRTDRFGAAVSRFGIASFVTDFANSEFRTFEHDYFGSFFWEEPELYERRSPLWQVGDVTTPTLILHGTEDSNTRPANSRELFTSLLEVGSEVELVMYPREGHGFREPSHEMDGFERMMDWFDRHLDVRDGKSGRVGEELETDAWTLLVRGTTHHDDLGGVTAPEAGWLEVDFILTAHGTPDPSSLALSGDTSPFRLVDAQGQERRPVGIVAEWSGGTHLVRGPASVDLGGEEGSWPFRLVFDLTDWSTPTHLQVLDLPLVRVHWPRPVPKAPEEAMK